MFEKIPKVEKKSEIFSPESLESRENSFFNNKVVVSNLFSLIACDIQQSEQISTITSIKDFFQWKYLDMFQDIFADYKNKSVYEIIKNCNLKMDDTMRLLEAANEDERCREASEYFNSLPYAEADNKEDGYWKAPIVDSSLTGTFYTNIYKHKSSDRFPTPIPEKRDYRVNISLEGFVGNVRAVLDLYKNLCSDDILAKHGFAIKGIGGHKTDNIIIYCGKNGLESAIKIVADYCEKENIGKMFSGVYFGIKPINRNGVKYKGISITSDPGKYTFNQLQSIVLYKTAIKTFHKISGTSFIDMKNLIEDSEFFSFVENIYFDELTKINFDVNKKNIAFPRERRM